MIHFPSPYQIDLGKIKAWFDENYEKSLAEMITGDTSGDYRKFLLSIVEWIRQPALHQISSWFMFLIAKMRYKNKSTYNSIPNSYFRCYLGKWMRSSELEMLERR